MLDGWLIRQPTMYKYKYRCCDGYDPDKEAARSAHRAGAPPGTGKKRVGHAAKIRHPTFRSLERSECAAFH